MRMVFGLVLIVGLALAGVAVYMTNNFVGQTTAALNKERELRARTGPLVEVYVVNKTLKYGDALTKDDVQTIFWQESFLPEGVFIKEEDLFPAGQNEPRFVMRQIEKFEPLLISKVTAPGQAAGLTGQLGKGEGAFAIKVDVASGVSGFVQPGDFVDVYWTGSAADSGNSTTQLIETGIRVIAVDQNTDEASGAAVVARTVTVAATREKVARLAQAAATGKMALSLVSSTDAMADAGRIEVNGRSLLGIAEQQEVVVAEPDRVCTIKTRKGADVIETPIPCTN